MNNQYSLLMHKISLYQWKIRKYVNRNIFKRLLVFFFLRTHPVSRESPATLKNLDNITNYPSDWLPSKKYLKNNK